MRPAEVLEVGSARGVTGETDVAVVGGGAAGLQVALTLGRSRRRVIVVDAGRPRHTPATESHNVLGWDGRPAAELLERGREELRRYDVALVTASVRSVRHHPTLARPFELQAGGATWNARAVVLAGGLQDQLPEVPGVREAWGRSVHACPYCHGWEVRDAPLALLGLRGWPGRLHHLAWMLRDWSSDLTVLTDGDRIEDEHRETFAAWGAGVDDGSVVEMTGGPGEVEVRTEGGKRHGPFAAVFAVTRLGLRDDLAQQLGCQLVEADDAGYTTGFVAADPSGVTSVPGVFAAGTIADPRLQIAGALGHGNQVAAACNAWLRRTTGGVSG